MLEIGREMVYGEASDALLAEAEEELIKEAMRLMRVALEPAASPARATNACIVSLAVCLRRGDRAR